MDAVRVRKERDSQYDRTFYLRKCSVVADCSARGAIKEYTMRFFLFVHQGLH